MRRLNPFTPGTGGLPPYLAGRAPEQQVIRRLFERMRAGAPPNRPLIFYGPRGNGKTALLRWARQEVEADEGLDGTWLTPTDIAASGNLAKRLQSGSWMTRLAPQNISVAGVAVGLRPSEEQPLLPEVLEARAAARPFVLFLDEAHTISMEIGRLLLNAAQIATGSAPFLLILAGTPDLEDRLSGIGASFWDRGDIRPLGRLGAEAAEAIRRPLADDGISIESEALERIVRESHGYPYFVQLWGEAVWERAVPAPDGGRRVTAAVAEAAAEEFESTKDRYYRRRYNELKAASLLPAAREVALAFRGNERLSDTALDDAVGRGAAAGNGPDAESAARTLRHLGLVWQSAGAPVWEPGIPSLMDFIREHAPAPTA